MKTKIITTLLLGLLIVTNVSFAQEDESLEKVHQNELSLNIRQIVNVFWGFPAPPVITDPYMLQYRQYIGEMGAIRIGAGVQMNNLETQIDTITQTHKFSALDFRAGWQFNEEAGKRFLFYYGADLFFASANNEQKYHVNSYGWIYTENSSKDIGIAPLIGLQFYLTPRVSLGTEANFRIASVKSSTKNTYELRPENDREVETTGISTAFWPPSSLYLNVRF